MQALAQYLPLAGAEKLCKYCDKAVKLQNK